jgi:hypothetical protein
MIVLAGAIDRYFRADFVGHVGPNLADPGGQWPPGRYGFKRLPKKLLGTLLRR